MGVNKKCILNNIYGDTLRKVIEDLKTQYNDYLDWENSTGESTFKERKRFLKMMKKPIKIYNKHYHGNIELPKLD